MPAVGSCGIMVADSAWLMCVLRAQYPMAIEMLQEGKIDVKPMITHRFGFTGRDEVIAGFECEANAARTKSIKVMFNLPGEA